MFIILPDHVPSTVCSEMIEIYENNKDKEVYPGCDMVQHWRGTDLILLNEISNKDDIIKCKHLTRFVNNTAVNFLGINTFIEGAQLVKWPVGSNQPFHHDDAREKTIFTSVTYLNDDFEGGETYFTSEDLMVKPKLGRTILFDGKKFEHGVKKITSGIRYTLALWYSSNVLEPMI